MPDQIKTENTQAVCIEKWDDLFQISFGMLPKAVHQNYHTQWGVGDPPEPVDRDILPDPGKCLTLYFIHLPKDCICLEH